ncbi:MAG: MBL fold metallo-hydrolase [Solirubrobacterales bacterium]
MIELRYIGHATTLIRLGRTTVLTDPVLRSRIGPLRRHGARPGPEAARPDVVLISHQHRDHLDLPSLRLLDARTPIVAPRGTAALIARAGAQQVIEVSAGEAREIAGVKVTATEALHDGHRGPWGGETEALGFVLEGQGGRVYFAGDTDLFGGMAALGPLDLALLPVWGWGPSLGSGHLDPAQAVRALRLLRPRVAVPIHWGTLYPAGLGLVRPRPLTEPPRLFARLAAQDAPEVEVRVLEPAEATKLEGTGSDRG